jgi:hypothetical protein
MLATPYTPPDPDMASNLDIRSIESGIKINPNCFIPAQIDNLGVKKSMEEEHYPPRVKSRETEREAER